MEGSQTFDPLLGSPSKPVESEDRGDQEATKPEPSPEMIRDAYATNLRDMVGPTHLFVAIACSLSDSITPAAFRVYRDRLLLEAGNPTDPIEIMLIEQIAMAHFHIGRLHLRSCSTEHHKLATAYADAATRLLGELRRCTLALEDFRAKQAARKDRAATVDAVDKATPNGSNGKPREPSRNGKKTAPATKMGNNGHKEMPEWLEKRMAYPTPNGSQLAASTGGNGKA